MFKLNNDLVRFEEADIVNGRTGVLRGYGYDTRRGLVISWKNTSLALGQPIGRKSTYALNGYRVHAGVIERMATEFLIRANRRDNTPAELKVEINGTEKTDHIVFEGDTIAFTSVSKKSQYFYAGTTLKTMLDCFRGRQIRVQAEDLSFLDVATGKVRQLKKITTYVLE